MTISLMHLIDNINIYIYTMYLQKLKNISSTTRNLSLPNYLKNSNNKNFFFFEKKKHLTKGRNNSGQIIIFSKKKKLNNYLINNSYLSW